MKFTFMHIFKNETIQLVHMDIEYSIYWYLNKNG